MIFFYPSSSIEIRPNSSCLAATSSAFQDGVLSLAFLDPLQSYVVPPPLSPPVISTQEFKVFTPRKNGTASLPFNPPQLVRSLKCLLGQHAHTRISSPPNLFFEAYWTQ